MEPVTQALYSTLATQGLPTLLLVFAIWFLNKMNQKAGEATDAARKQTDAEREARLADLQSRIVRNELDIKECETDRHRLWIQVLQGQQDAINAIRSTGPDAFKAAATEAAVAATAAAALKASAA